MPKQTKKNAVAAGVDKKLQSRLKKLEGAVGRIEKKLAALTVGVSRSRAVSPAKPPSTAKPRTSAKPSASARPTTKARTATKPAASWRGASPTATAGPAQAAKGRSAPRKPKAAGSNSADSSS